MSESNINVAIKIRPLIKREIDKKIPACWVKRGNSLIDTVVGTNEFNFDLIFDETSTTGELYEKLARPIVSKALAGVNGTVFAYGQTSSGKTHTMMGDESNDGLMLMAIKHIFSEVERQNIEFVLRVGFIELYNEKVYDLYDPENVDLKMVEKNNDAYVNCREVICKCVDDMYDVIKVGNKNKKIGDTDMNDRSSRSHTIFRISIESVDAVSEKAKVSNLNLVDLAGSERASQTGATGTRFVEGAHINKSLLSLSKVINKLINNENCHINYRDSKLTRYLQSSLGGNALAAIICTICPTALDESISTLYFAQRAMKVTNKPIVNEIISDATMIKQLHNQIKALKLELQRAQNGANSAVPRIMQELSLHQGNILNYKKAESKSKLRRRTWNTFGNELEVISETNALIPLRREASASSINDDAIAPTLINLVTSDRGTGQFHYDATNELNDEFEFKSKYEKLLLEFEELQEFTNWEKKFDVGPGSGMEMELTERINTLETELANSKAQVGMLEKDTAKAHASMNLAQQEKVSIEYLFEQHQKKAESREKDLLALLEEMKPITDVSGALEEKNRMIEEQQERIKEIQQANDEMSAKLKEFGVAEEKVLKLEVLEGELVELRNTITVLTNTILTLENEKKEMSIRFNESMSASAFEITTAGAGTASAVALQSSISIQTDTHDVVSSGDLKKLELENDELSAKLMDVIEENDDLKQRVEDLNDQLDQLRKTTNDLHEQIVAARIPGVDSKAELVLINSEKDCLTEQLQLAAEKMEQRDSELKSATDMIRELETKLGGAERDMNASEQKLQLSEEALKEAQVRLNHLESELNATALSTVDIHRLKEEISRLKEEAVKSNQKLEREQQEMESRLEDQVMRNTELELTIENLRAERDQITREMSAQESHIQELVANKEALAREVEAKIEEWNVLTVERERDSANLISLKEKLRVVENELELAVQKEHAVTVEKDCLVNELRNKIELISQLEMNVEASHSDLKKLLLDAQMDKERLTTELANNGVELEQLKRDHEDLSKRYADQTEHLQSIIKQLNEDLAKNSSESEQKLSVLRDEHCNSKVEWETQMKSISDELNTLATESTKKVTELQQELSLKSERIREMETLCEIASTQDQKAKAAIEEVQCLKRELESQLQQVYISNREKCELNVQLESLRETLAEKDTFAKNLQSELSELTKQLNLSQTEINEMKEQVHALEVQQSLDQTELRKKDSDVVEYLKQMRELEGVIECKSIEIADIKAKLAEALTESEKESKLRIENEAAKEELKRVALVQQCAETRFEELGRKLQNAEEARKELQKQLLAASDQRDTATISLERLSSKHDSLEEKHRCLQEKHEILMQRVQQLEADLSAKEKQLSESSQRNGNSAEKQMVKMLEEEISRLQAHNKRMRSEIGDLQKKEPRKARRSSTFDTNRHLWGDEQTVGTQTDAVSELCQCEALNLKVIELQRSNLVKDMQMVELREAEKRSPALIENFQMKKLLMAAKEKEASYVKEKEMLEQRVVALMKQAKTCKVCDNKKVQTVSCQTMPDLNLTKIADTEKQLSMITGRYEEVKRITRSQNDKIKSLELELIKARQEVERTTQENNQNRMNQPEDQNLRQKYELVKNVVEERYHRIVRLEQELAAVRSRRTCMKCKTPLVKS